MLDGSFFVECACGSDEHTLRFILDAEEPCLYTNVYLNASWRPFYKRLWLAIKYVFGKEGKHGHFDSFVMYELDSAYKLKEMVDTYIDLVNTKISVRS